MDYGKFKYETAQKAKESRRKSTNVSVKEMKYRPKIGGGDFETKTRKVEKFLDEGHKVKVTIMFRGREVAHPELGKKILDHVAETVAHLARVEVYPRLDGRNMIMVLGPDKKAQAAHAAALKREAEERGEVVPDTDDTAAATPAAGEEPSTNGAAPAASLDETDTDTARQRRPPHRGRRRRGRRHRRSGHRRTGHHLLRPPHRLTPSDPRSAARRPGLAPPARAVRRGRTQGSHMPKMKTHRGAAKRFKVTGSGKIMRRKAYRAHILEKKSSVRTRRLAGETEVTGGDRDRMKKLLGL